jgi:phospholipid/cholesterol/gamma-HCH transport system substrate-binding protein
MSNPVGRVFSHRLARLLSVAIAACVAIGVVVVVVKASDGAFTGQYTLTGVFPRSGEGLHAGSEVVYRGVQVGRVTTITLDERRAKVQMAIDPDFKVPADATAQNEPLNV